LAETTRPPELNALPAPAGSTPSGTEGVRWVLPFGVQVRGLPLSVHSSLTEFERVKTPPTASTVNGAAGDGKSF